MPQSSVGPHAVRESPPSPNRAWGDALRAAVYVACHRALTAPGPCSRATLSLALRRLRDGA